MSVSRSNPPTAAPEAQLLNDRAIGLFVAIAAALPTLAAAALRPALLLDDIEFAARARFEGWGGFVNEMGYRPGQGLIHAIQFNVLGEHASLHLIVLAAGNALAAVLFWRLLIIAVPRGIAIATTVTFVVLPNRGALRYWTSTLPNHVAMCLLLGAAIVVASRVDATRVERRNGSGPVDHSTVTWLAVTGLSLLSIVTYEATISLAPLLTLVLALTSSSRRGRVVLPLSVFGLFGAAALVMKVRSPRAASTTLFARPLDGIPNHLESLVPSPYTVLGVVAVLGCTAWGSWQLIRQHAAARQEAKVVVVGVVLAIAGLAPFIAASFNIQSQGVLDRAHYFPSLGTALAMGAGIHALRSSTDSNLVRPVLFAAAAFSVMGVVDDLGPYKRASAEHREAASALAALDPPSSWVGDPYAWTETDEGVRIADPPAAGGVGWGFYSAQVRDLYRLVHDDPIDPTWLALANRPIDDVPPNLAYFDIEAGELVEAPG